MKSWKELEHNSTMTLELVCKVDALSEVFKLSEMEKDFFTLVLLK